MSRPQKMHQPLPFSFNQILSAIGAGNGVEKPLPKTQPATKDSKTKPANKKSK
jgi:hypothetical protein